MAELKNEASVEEEDRTPLPAKRKLDHECIDLDDDRKSKKPEISDNNHHLDEENLKLDGENPGAEAEAEAESKSESEEEEEDEEEANGKGVVDTKGKGIMKDDKGKGKSVVHEGGEDSDSSNDGNPSDDDSDLSDDPLAEVDLDNILPSRTRRRVAQLGAYLINDLDDDDESDDSDA